MVHQGSDTRPSPRSAGGCTLRWQASSRHRDHGDPPHLDTKDGFGTSFHEPGAAAIARRRRRPSRACLHDHTAVTDRLVIRVQWRHRSPASHPPTRSRQARISSTIELCTPPLRSNFLDGTPRRGALRSNLDSREWPAGHVGDDLDELFAVIQVIGRVQFGHLTQCSNEGFAWNCCRFGLSVHSLTGRHECRHPR